ncbi:MAG: hypothetical protein ACO32I_08590 [Candidatus Limnocylindrus sp.]
MKDFEATMRASDPLTKLTPKQRQVARLIGAGETQRAAAERVGVSEQSVSTWINDDDGLGHAMAVAISAACDDALAKLIAKATGALDRHLDDPNPDTAVKAADVIFRRKAQVEKRDHGFRQLELQREALAKGLDADRGPTGIVRVKVPEERE